MDTIASNLAAPPAPHAPGPQPPLRMNWGCGSTVEPGWINSDLKDEPGVDIVGDLRDGLPLPDDHLDYVVSIHALNMIEYPALVPALEELRRVLRPGGTLRLALPDFDRAIRAYVDGDRSYFLVPDEHEPTLGGKLIVQLLWYGWSVTMFTEDFVRAVLLRAGFRAVHRCEYQVSASGQPGITDLDNREGESFFVEAVK